MDKQPPTAHQQQATEMAYRWWAIGGSVVEWLVRWITKLATRVRFPVAAGLSTASASGDLTGYCYQQYLPRLDNRGGNGTHLGLCWKYIVPPIPVGDFPRLPTLNK